MASKTPLGLSVPETTYAPDNTFFLDLKKIQSWVSALPMANIGETSRQVFKTIVELNRLDVPNLNRIKTVELFRQPIAYISRNLRKHYLDLPFPLSPRNQKVAVLCREFHSELANSYKHVIVSIVNEGQEQTEQKLLIIAIHQALYYLLLALRYSAVVYNPYPANVWKEIHLLYSLAARYNIEKTAVRENGKNEGGTSTILDLYKRCLLFAMIPPYRLRQREIEYVYQRLPELALYLQIMDPKSQSNKATQFVVPVGSDEPPLHTSLDTASLTEISRVVDTSLLVDHLQGEIKDIADREQSGSTENQTDQIARLLLQKMIFSFGMAPQRKFVRTSLNFELDIAVGLSAIHALMIENAKSGEDESEGPMVREEITLTITPLDLPFEDTGFITDDAEDIWSGQTTSPSPWTQSGEEKQYETFHCRTFNESAGGYCIELSGRDAPKIRVGELVGIQSASNKSQFSIGVTRWIKNVPVVGLEFGIEVIALHAFPVSVSHTDKPGSIAASQNALMLPEQKTSRQPNSLIVPALPYQTNDTLSLDGPDGKQHIRLSSLLESTGAFARFQFIYIDPGQIKKPEPKKETEDDTNFDKIWDIL